MAVEELITGSERLTALFGKWPSFHDAEVLSLRLDRGAVGAGPGPTLDVVLHAFEITDQVAADGFLVLRNHVLVHLRFHGVVELELRDFNQQNSLFWLRIEDIRAHQLEGIGLQVGLDASFGVGASFECHHAEVVSVLPCDKSGRPLPA